MISTTLDGIEGARTIIVGSGPAGLTVALELERFGLSCLVLESGLDGASDAQDLSDADVFDPSRHDAMKIAVSRRLGGTSHLWGGRCVPLDPIDFQPRRFADFTTWPIGLAEIARYYPTACHYVACGEAIFTAEPAPVYDTTFSTSTLERASNRPRFARAYRDRLRSSRLIDVRLGATVVDLVLRDDGSVSQVTAVDRAGRKVSLAATQIVVAVGGVETARLLLTLQRRHASLFGGSDGALGRYYMGHLIGEIADIVFSRDDLDAAFDFFRDGHGSFVRRRLVPSEDANTAGNLPNICLWPVVPPIADPIHGSGALSAVAMALSMPGIGEYLIPEAIRKRHLDGTIDWGAHARNLAIDLLGSLHFLATFAYHRYISDQRIHGYFLRNRARRYGLSYSSEHSPNCESRVTLTSECDRLGMPKAAIDLRFRRHDAEGVVRAHAVLAEGLAASGAGAIVYRTPVDSLVETVLVSASHGTHQIGLARMGSDRRNAVVDGDLRCFDCRNLFLVGSAVFPTSSQANPTLSIVALAARLAERLSGNFS